MGPLIYRKFVADVDFDWGDLVYFGYVVNADVSIGFCGNTFEEAQQDFHEAVDAYLAVRAQLWQGQDQAA